MSRNKEIEVIITNTNKREIMTAAAAGILPVIWIALKAAPLWNGNLFELFLQIDEMFSQPLHVLRCYPYGSYNIGVGNTAIVKIAEQQLGNHGGRKFWSWYGFSGRVSWCGCFVSWCADQCGYIKSGTIPKFSYVPDIVDWAKSHHQWQTRNYKPSPGDIIVVDWYTNGTRDHVGIVEKCVGNIVYTIEGNRSDQVKRGAYTVGSSLIYGYLVPKY